MIVIPETKTVKDNFSAAAERYNLWARPQKRIAEALCRLIPGECRAETILELGCGTGLLTGHLIARFTPCHLTALDIAPGMIAYCRKNRRLNRTVRFLTTSAEDFVPQKRFDLAAGSLSFQWFSDKNRVLHKTASCLREDGVLALSVPLTGTFRELSFSYRAATGEHIPSLDLPDAQSYCRLCKNAGFSVSLLEQKTLPFSYKNAQQAVRGIQQTGATFRNQSGFKQLSFVKLRKLLNHYDSMFPDADGNVPLTYEVLFMILKKGTQ